MSNNLTCFIINLTFKADEIENLHVEIETKIKRYIPLFNDKPKYDLYFNENYDYFTEESRYNSRTYYAIINKFESINNKLKIKIKSKSGQIFESDLKNVKLNDINVYFDLSFKSYDGKDINQNFFRMKKTRSLFQFNLIMKLYFNELSEETNFEIKKRITEESYSNLLNLVNKDDKIDHIISLYIYMRKYLESNKADDFFRIADNHGYLISDIPAKIEEFNLIILVRSIMEDINISRIKMNDMKILFILNFIFFHKFFEELININFERIHNLREIFYKLRFKKVNYKIDRGYFEKLIQNVIFNRNIELFINLYGLIEKDNIIIECLDQSWKSIPENFKLNLFNFNERSKIEVSQILSFLNLKSLETAKMTFKYIDQKQLNASHYVEEKLEIENEYDINSTMSEPLILTFSKIFYFDLEKILEIFLKENEETQHFKFLCFKAEEYKRQNKISENFLTQKIYKKLDFLIFNDLLNLKNYISLLKRFLEFQQHFPERLEIVLNTYRNKGGSNINNLVEKITNFSNDIYSQKEEIEFYTKIDFPRFFKPEILYINELELKKLDFRFNSFLYNEEKIKLFLLKDNNYQHINLLFEKIIKVDFNKLEKFIQVLIDILNQYSTSIKEDESSLKEINQLIKKHLLGGQIKNFNLEKLLGLYMEENIFERLNFPFNKSFEEFFLKIIGELNLEKYLNIIELIFEINFYKKGKVFISFVIKIFEISKKFIPSKYDFFERVSNINIKLFNKILKLIKSPIKIDYGKNNLKKNKPNKSDFRNEVDIVINIENQSQTNNLIEIDNKENYSFDDYIPQKNPFKYLLYEENGTLDLFLKFIRDLNKEFFNNGFKIKHYSFISSEMENYLFSDKLFLLGVLEEESDKYIEQFKSKLNEVQTAIKLLHNINNFLGFYFKNSIENDDLLQKFFVNYLKLNQLNFNDLKNFIFETEELVNLFEKFSKIDGEPFKKIYQFFKARNKDKNNFTDIIGLLNITERKIEEMKNCLLSDYKNLFMKEIKNVFLPFLDKNIFENLNEFKNFYNVDTNGRDKLLINALKHYSCKSSIYDFSEKLMRFFDLYKIKIDKFYKNLQKNYENLKKCEDIKIQDYLESFENNNLDQILYNQELLNLVNLLIDNLESYQFFINKEEDDLRNLIEFVDDLGDIFIKPDTIKNCLKILDFSKKLFKEISEKKDQDVIDFLCHAIKNSKSKSKCINIIVYLDDVTKNINGIKQLYNKVANKEEYSKIKIKEMYNASNFKIFQEKNENNFDLISYICTGTYGDNKQTNFEEIRDLRDRSLLLSKKKIFSQFNKLENKDSSMKFNDIMNNETIQNQSLIEIEENKFEKEENEYLKICKGFSDIVNHIIIIFENLDCLFQNGYHENYEVKFNIIKGEIEININNNKYDSKEALEYFEKCMKELEVAYEKNFSKYPLLSFLHGRQIFTLYESLVLLNPRLNKINQSLNDKTKIYEGLYLLNYLFESNYKKKDLKDVWFPIKKETPNLKFFEVLEYVAEFLEKLKKEKDKEKESKNINNKSNNKNYKEGLYSAYLKKEEFEKEIINLYQNFLREKLPNFKQILICDDTTSLLLIKSFIYRAFYYKSDEPFILINSDELRNDYQLEIHNLINRLSFGIEGQDKKIKSIFVITYSNPQLEYVNKIKKLQGIINLNFKNIEEKPLKELFKTESNRTFVVKSDASGVGKSFHIKSIAKKKKLEYKYYPISGVIQKFELIHRIKQLKLKKKSLLHVDLNECDNEYITRSFLFELLITNCLVHNEYVFKFGDNVLIYIEIPFGFIDFISKYPILENFETIIISKQNKAELDLTENSDNFQIVANYLMNLKNNNIIDKNIYLSCLCENNIHGDMCLYNHSITLKKISKQEIYRLINEYFDLKEHSFYQIKTFINFLAFQFKLFSQNYYFGVSLLKNNQAVKNRELLSAREILVKSFLDITKYFTKSAYNNLLSMQENTQKFMLHKEKGSEREILKNLLNENILSYNNINFNMVFFNNDGQGISIIVKNHNPNDEKYKKLLYLYNACTLEKKDKDLINYEKLSNIEFLEQLQIVLGKQGLVLRDYTGIEGLYNTNGYVFTLDNFLKMQLILLRINSNIPVIMMGETGCGKTSLIKILADLLKMDLHILNIHAGIEDKDIVNFIQKINEKEEEKDKCFNERKETNILDFFNISNKKSTDFIFTEQTHKSNVWIFLDEINTCNSLGLIAEILCKRSYLGKEIHKNICFICACNPYRLYTNLIGGEIGLQYNSQNNIENLKNISQALAYKVNPLPFCLLNYVFDFGSLTEKDELKYIESMISKHFIDEKIIIPQKENMIDFLTKLINSSQIFIRKQNSEISSVSLRDVRRFIIFLKWFIKSIFERASFENSIYHSKFKEKNNENLIIISSLLSILLIYYLRLPRKDIKFEFIKMICNNMSLYYPIYKDSDSILNILVQEEKDILKRVETPRGIAWNSALLENVFAAFHCINNKVPVFICGKPGCSKSLAIQLIYSSMRGENSKDLYFKRLPRLFMHCYQGSVTSKSSGIINVFKKARNLIKGNHEAVEENKNNNKIQPDNHDLKVKQDKVISLVYFDEMGLAEISKNNPLKVLHSELEPNEESDKVAFVGISNWRLDASKSNRGIFIGRPDLDEEDLISTAKTIAESYVKNESNVNFDKKKNNVISVKDSNNFLDYNIDDELMNINQIERYLNDLNKYNQIFEFLAKAYFDYKLQIKEQNIKKDGFHGTRDFYYMIKNIAKSIINANNYLNEDEVSKIIEISINRNFSGLKNSLYLFKECLVKYYPAAKGMEINQTKAIQAIKYNLEDQDSRFLMIIGDSQVSINFLQNIISNISLNKNHNRNPNNKNSEIKDKENIFTFLVGSQFESDIEINEKNSHEYNEEYSFKILNKIQVYMEQGNILILSGLSCIYPSLYDLFNQNFSIVGGKKHARIALGTSNNPMAYVHNNFKCIIILNEDEVENQDPPFLNRFEKTNINFETLIKDEYRSIGKSLYRDIKNWIMYDSNEKENIQLDLIKNMINFNENEIFGLIYLFTELENEFNFVNIESKIYEKIIPTFSQDIIAILNYNLRRQKKFEILNKLNKIYKENLNNNLEEYILKKFDNSLKQNKTNIEVNLVYSYNSIFDEIKLIDKQIKAEIHPISFFKSESNLEKTFLNFLNKDNNTFILQFNMEDLRLLNYSKFLCEQTYKSSNIHKNKLFIFIIYTSRVFVEKKTKNLNNEQVNKKNVYLSDNKNCISFISEGDQIFIDNLNAIKALEIDINKIYDVEDDDIDYNINFSSNVQNDNLNYNKYNNNLINLNNNYNLQSLSDSEQLNNKSSKDYMEFDNERKKYLNILDLVNLSIYQIIKRPQIFDKEKNVNYALYDCYMKFGFDSENYQEDEYKNYINSIIELIKNNSILKETLILKTIKEISKIENWLIILLGQKELLNEKYDLITILKYFLNAQFQNYLCKILFKLEQDDMLEYLLFYSEDKIIYNHFCLKTIKTIENLSIEDIKIKDKFGGNIIKRIFGLKLPQTKNSLQKIMSKIDDNLFIISRKEEELRNSNYQSEEEYEKSSQEYKKIKVKLESDIVQIFKRNELVQDLLNELDEKNFSSIILKNFFEDFILYYKTLKLSINGNMQENIQIENKSKIIKNEEIIKIIKFIITAEFNKVDIKMENLSKYILFLMNNTMNIQKFLDIFISFKKYDSSYLDFLHKNIEDVTFPENPKTIYIEILNKGQYKISCAIINYILEKIANIKTFEENQNFDFLNEIKIIKDKLVEIDYSLMLNNKLIKNLEVIDKFNSFFLLDNKEILCDFFNEYFVLIEKESNLIKTLKIRELEQNLYETYDLIVETFRPIILKKLSDDKNIEKRFNQFLIEFLNIKYQAYENEKHRENIANMIISKENLLNNCQKFIQNYFFYNYNNEYELAPFYDEETKQGDPETFGQFAKKDSEFIKLIENKISSKKLDQSNSYLLHSIILIFEIYIWKYFNLISLIQKEPEFHLEILNGSSFLYFKKAVSICENINQNKNLFNNLNTNIMIIENENMDNGDFLYPFIIKLYAITYIKIFIEKYVSIIYNKGHEYDFKNINKILNKKNKISLVIKLYILKVLKEKYLKTWEELEKFDYNKHQMNWKFETKELNIKNKEKNFGSTFFIDFNQQNLYKEIEHDLKIIIGQNFKKNAQGFLEKIDNEKKLCLFLDSLINVIFVNLTKEKNGSKNNLCYKEFCEFFGNNIKIPNLRNISVISGAFKNAINIFPDIFSLSNQFEEDYENYFVLIKIFIILINSPKDSLYDFSLNPTNKNFYKQFNERYLPGTYNNNIRNLILSYKEIKKINDSLAEKTAHCIGCYLCVCEAHYFVQPCGSPTESQNCFSCNAQIGAVNNVSHTLVPNNLRIFKNDKHRQIIIKSLGMRDAAFPFKFTEDLKIMIDERIQNTNPNFIQIPKEEIHHSDLSLPHLDPITFRILNIIQNLFLYLNYKLIGSLNEDNYNKFKHIDFGCKENIESSLFVLKRLLEKVNIKNTALYLNFVLEKIVFQIFYKSKIILNCKQKIEKEIEINEIIKKSISLDSDEEYNYSIYIKKNLQAQESFDSIDPFALSTLLDDEKNKKVIEQDSENFPDYQFYRYKKEFSESLFKEKLEEIPNYEREHPIIFNFITRIKSIEKLKNINKLNPFVNEMINKYSDRLSRREAKLQENTIASCLDKISENSNKTKLLRKFEIFREGWQDIYRNAVQYGCRQKMEPLSDIKLNNPIANVLNDDGEYKYGMYIAAGYQYLNQTQNEFLTAVQNAINTNVRLIYLKDNFKNKIIVQKAKPFEVISIDTESFGKFVNFEDLIYQNSYINNLNYDQIEFDFNSIEKFLSSILIQGKKHFSEEQIFVVYTYEFFRRNNSAIITNFSNKVDQLKINIDDRYILNEYISSSIDKAKKGERFLGTLFRMIFYLQNTDFDADITLILASEKMETYVEIDESLKVFLRKNTDLTLKKLVAIYNYVEKICYDSIKENISKDYQKLLSDKKKQIINEFYLNNHRTIISKTYLATAVRRFISRFLTKEDDYDKTHSLLPILFVKEEFWEKEIFNDQYFETENESFLDFIRNSKIENENNMPVDNENDDLEIKISESMDLYDFLGEDKEIIKENMEIQKESRKEENKDFMDIDDPFNNFDENKNNIFQLNENKQETYSEEDGKKKIQNIRRKTYKN